MDWKVYASQMNFIFVDLHIIKTVELTNILYDKSIITGGNLRFQRITIGTMVENRKLVAAIKK